jgi:hypothetical protein
MGLTGIHKNLDRYNIYYMIYYFYYYYSYIIQLFQWTSNQKMMFKHRCVFSIIMSKMFAVEQQPGVCCDVLKCTWSITVV